MILFISIFLGILLYHPPAYAWGPVTHISMGLEILDNVSMLLPALQELLLRYPLDYLYGCIAPDIILKKDWVAYEHNCHSWNVGLKLLDKATTDQQKAFAYGYLAHLSTDAISHNYFVPYHIVAATMPSVKFQHFYWELKLDTLQVSSQRNLTRQIAKFFHNSIHDEFLGQHLKRTLFSFKTNKHIFNSLIHSVSSYKLLAPSLKYSLWTLTDENVREYRLLSVTAACDFLNTGTKSKYFKMDPCGRKAIARAKILKKQFKHHRKFLSPSDQWKETLPSIRNEFRELVAT